MDPVRAYECRHKMRDDCQSDEFEVVMNYFAANIPEHYRWYTQQVASAPNPQERMARIGQQFYNSVVTIQRDEARRAERVLRAQERQRRRVRDALRAVFIAVIVSLMLISIAGLITSLPGR